MPVSTFVEQIDQKSSIHWKKLYGDNFYTPEYHIESARKHIHNVQEQVKLKEKYGEDRKERYIYLTQSIFGGNLDSIGTDLLRYAVHKRIEEDNPQYLLDGLLTYGRLKYLAYSFSDYRKGKDSLGHSRGGESYHVGEMLLSQAAADWTATDKFLHQLPGPFSKGHIVTKLFATLLYLILNDDPQDFPEAEKIADQFRNDKSIPKYYKNEGLILEGILKRNTEMVMKSLQYILETNWRMRDNLPYGAALAGEGISFNAHAFYNIMYMIFEKHNVTIPDPPIHDAWDTDYNLYIHQKEHKPKLIIDFSKVSPVLSDWLEALPASIDIFSL